MTPHSRQHPQRENIESKINIITNTFKEKIQPLFREETLDLTFPSKLSEITSKFLRSLAETIATKSDRLAIVATGGFGRGELAPWSDIDLLFLVDRQASENDKKLISELNRCLWNARIKPGYSVRTLDECRKAMGSDLNFLTSLLEIRYIHGDKHTYRKLQQLVREHLESAPPGKFIAAKLEERDARHRKMGDSRYQLEPNVKESKGGLRDIQTLLWITSFASGAGTPEELARKGLLTAAEAETLRSALLFFWQVRCHLHLITGRGDDRLSFDVQPEVARRMGYTDTEPNLRAEKFMKDYFRMSTATGHLTRVLCADMEARTIVTTATAGTRKLVFTDEAEGFPLAHNRLTVRDQEHFLRVPADILRIFRVSQTTGHDIHPDALRLLPAALLSASAWGLRTFLDILLDKKGAEQTLRRMNEAGVLSAVIPDFANIHAHMQYDMYHVFTADEHTIRAVGVMHRLEEGALGKEAPLATALFSNIRSRRALYAAMFLHDIAKGTGGQHAAKGADTARRLCPQLGLDTEETETAAWLVENHLLMTMTALKRDLSDDKTVADFVAEVQSPERLKLLTILTTADIMAVGPDRWNNWKSGLLAELHQKSTYIMAGAQPEHGETDQLIIAQRKARRIAGGNKTALQYLADKAPKSFWTSFLPEDAARYAGYIAAAADDKAPALIETCIRKEQGFTEVFVYVSDRKGLFATLSGAIAAAGASIVDARVFTLGDGMALDVFQVHSFSDGIYENQRFLTRMVRNALAGHVNIDAEIAERHLHAPKKNSLFAVAARVIIDNNASATSTMIEVNGKDRPGFLYDITSALSQMGLQIVAAKVTTFGSRAVDVFYVKDAFGLKILHSEKLISIQNALKNSLEKTV